MAREISYTEVVVGDINATLDAAAAAGGQPLVRKTLIGGEMGYWGLFEAPGGVKMGLWSKD